MLQTLYGAGDLIPPLPRPATNDDVLGFKTLQECAEFILSVEVDSVEIMADDDDESLNGYSNGDDMPADPGCYYVDAARQLAQAYLAGQSAKAG